MYRKRSVPLDKATCVAILIKKRQLDRQRQLAIHDYVLVLEFALESPTFMPTSRTPPRCSVPDCIKKAQSRQLCIAHGGGTRCRSQNCQKLAQSRGLCVGHGGGRRCAVNGCGKLSQSKGVCLAHGGGRRCRVPDCQKFRQIRNLCKAHAKLQVLSNVATISWSSNPKSNHNRIYNLSPTLRCEPLVANQTYVMYPTALRQLKLVDYARLMEEEYAVAILTVQNWRRVAVFVLRTVVDSAVPSTGAVNFSVQGFMFGSRRWSTLQSRDCQKFRQIRDLCKAHAKLQKIVPTSKALVSTDKLSNAEHTMSKLSISFLVHPLQ
ncbi:hypothetical protein PHPALM_29330 [Phytophthora palmivora]|uniref:WRKY19-like zinc finger domain-containing protein n=1 Tax=Phytophthora palmivora TaxID=4796 RepID=A0A2P4X7W9_9STRA|nr:hypothetical protein PHPALM_29330 [Phytophthora palmivora]